MMQANMPFPPATHVLPDGYKFVLFNGGEKDISDWKGIISSEPDSMAGELGIDECYNSSIKNYPDLNLLNDVFLLENSVGERVATITTVTRSDGFGYVHMVKAKKTESGKGLGHALIEHAMSVFIKRKIQKVVLTTDDFRLPAIKTYLDAGFCPVVYGKEDSPINKRWDVVLENLKYRPVSRILGQPPEEN